MLGFCFFFLREYAVLLYYASHWTKSTQAETLIPYLVPPPASVLGKPMWEEKNLHAASLQPTDPPTLTRPTRALRGLRAQGFEAA